MEQIFQKIKRDAKSRIFATQNKVLLTSVIYTVILFLISYLTTRLSNYDDYYNDYYRALLNYTESGSLDAFDSLVYPMIQPLAMILLSAIGLMTTVMSAGFDGYCLQCSRDTKSEFKDIFNGFVHFFKIIGIRIMIVLVIIAYMIPAAAAILVSVFVLADSGLGIPAIILCIAAGIYAVILAIRTALQYSFVYYVMFDNPNMTVIECLRTSRQITKGKLISIFALRFSFIGWYILNAVISSFFLPVLNIWIYPYAGISVASYYNAIIDKYIPYVAPVDDGNDF